MANMSLFVFIVASLCLFAQSAPISDVERIIGETIGQNIGMAMAELKQIVRTEMATATSPEQKKCIGTTLHQKTIETVKELKETAKELRTELDTPQGASDLDAVRTRVKSVIGQLRIEAVDSTIKQITVCKQ